jgi:tetratricopeptide (TPR) repeat protein
LQWPYFEIGAILAKAGKPGPALEALGESIRLKPTVKALGMRASIYFTQGEVLGKENDWEAAKPFFQKAQADAVQGIGMQPKAVRLWSIKTGTHLMLNEHDQACQSMRKACELGDCSIIAEFSQCEPGGT